ncbi:MAG: hypothetical protein J6Y02_08215 [Pseudobutyrivibrio sp.]|nr:hypothetical protein [Pseudobutyrivibrio sp.]
MEVGTELTLTATPETDCKFDGWQVDGEFVSTNSTLNLTVIDDVDIIAVFSAIVFYQINILSSDNDCGVASVISQSEEPRGEAFNIWPEGTVINLRATAAPGGRFLNWDNGSMDINRTITVDANKTVRANFYPESGLVLVTKKMFQKAWTCIKNFFSSSTGASKIGVPADNALGASNLADVVNSIGQANGLAQLNSEGKVDISSLSGSSAEGLAVDITGNAATATTATTATKIGITTVGSVSQPVYINAGTPAVCNEFAVLYNSAAGEIYDIGYLTVTTGSNQSATYNYDNEAAVTYSQKVSIDTTKTNLHVTVSKTGNFIDFEHTFESVDDQYAYIIKNVYNMPYLTSAPSYNDTGSSTTSVRSGTFGVDSIVIRGSSSFGEGEAWNLVKYEDTSAFFNTNRNDGGYPKWFEIYTDTAINVRAFTLLPRQDATYGADEYPKEFKLQGSNDGSSYADIASYTQSTTVNPSDTYYTYKCPSNTGLYKYHRLLISSRMAGTDNVVSLSKFLITEAYTSNTIIATSSSSAYSVDLSSAKVAAGISAVPIGSTSQPVYIDNNGMVAACENSLDVDITGNAATATNSTTVKEVYGTSNYNKPLLLSGLDNITTATDNQTTPVYSNNFYANPSTGVLSATGGFSSTGSYTTSLTTGTYLAGNKGTAIINSTAAAGYTVLSRMKSTNGVFTQGVHNENYKFTYTADSIISASTNSVSKTCLTMNENGTVSAPSGVVGITDGIPSKCIFRINVTGMTATSAAIGTVVPNTGIGGLEFKVAGATANLNSWTNGTSGGTGTGQHFLLSSGGTIRAESSGITIGTAFTFCATTDTGTSYWANTPAIFEMSTASDGSNAENRVFIGFNSSRQIRLVICGSDGTSYECHSALAVASGSSARFGVSVNGNNIIFVHNGVSETATLTNTRVSASMKYFSVGNFYHAPANRQMGHVAFPTLWNQALTAAQMITLLESGVLYDNNSILVSSERIIGTLSNDTMGNAANVTGTVAIANGGTGATTRLNALKALTNESVGTNATHFLTITNSWGKGGYTSVADAKKVLGIDGSIPIYYVQGPSTDTTAGTWTGSITGLTAYYDGLTILYVPAVAGANPTTLNINNLGAVSCYYTNTSVLTTHYSVGTPILLTYRDNAWRRADYNSNTTYSAMSVSEGTTGTATTSRTVRADYLKQIIAGLPSASCTGDCGGNATTATTATNADYAKVTHSLSNIEYPLVFTSAITSTQNYAKLLTGTPTVTAADCALRCKTYCAAANTQGEAYIVCGNGLPKEIANNARGSIYLYGTNDYNTRIIPSNTSANVTITLPASTGTLALTSSNITGNAASATYATNVRITPSDGTTAYPVTMLNGSTASTNYALRTAVNNTTVANSGLKCIPGADVAADTEGTTTLVIGNALAKATADNRTGNIRIHGNNTGYTTIKPGYNSTSNIAVTLPSSAGTLALASSCDPAIKTELQDVDCLDILKTLTVKRFKYSQKKIDEKQWKKDNPDKPLSEMPEFKDNEHEPWYIHTMAQEFNEAFNVDDGNPDEIKPINEIGVCLRAIQELASQVDELKKQVEEISKLRKEYNL